MCDVLGDFLIDTSDRKLETKAPKRKHRMKLIKTNASAPSFFTNSSAKKAKCPVTFVVSVAKAKTPVMLTIPATKERLDANFKLCANVLVFPL